jgi:hypothetical protein
MKWYGQSNWRQNFALRINTSHQDSESKLLSHICSVVPGVLSKGWDIDALLSTIPVAFWLMLAVMMNVTEAPFEMFKSVEMKPVPVGFRQALSGIPGEAVAVQLQLALTRAGVVNVSLNSMF